MLNHRGAMEDPCWKKSECYKGRGLTRLVPFEHDRVKIVECVTFKSLPYSFLPKISERACRPPLGDKLGHCEDMWIVFASFEEEFDNEGKYEVSSAP